MSSTNPLTAITERLREIAKKRELEKKAKKHLYGKGPADDALEAINELNKAISKPTKPVAKSAKRKGRRSDLH